MPSIITVLGGRIRFANIDANLEGKGSPPPTPLLNTIVARISGASTGTSDGIAAASTLPPEIPTYNTDRSFVTDFVNFARQQKLYVCWIGIQEMVKPDCEPFPSCACTTVFTEPPVKKAEPPPRNKRRKSTRRINISRELILQFLNLNKDKP